MRRTNVSLHVISLPSSSFTSTSPSSSYVGIDQSITYGKGGPTILSSTAGIVDTGTTLTLIASGKSTAK